MNESEADLSMVRNDFPSRLQRRLRLIPDEGLGIGRRAILLGTVAWLPIATWALLVDRFLPGRSAEPFIDQFSIHARCLFAISLFILPIAIPMLVVAALQIPVGELLLHLVKTVL